MTAPQHHIFQTLLRRRSLFNDPRDFPGVLPPITIINTPYRYLLEQQPEAARRGRVEPRYDTRFPLFDPSP